MKQNGVIINGQGTIYRLKYLVITVFTTVTIIVLFVPLTSLYVFGTAIVCMNVTIMKEVLFY